VRGNTAADASTLGFVNATSLSRMRRVLAGWQPSSNVSEAFGKLFAALDLGQTLLKHYKINLHRLKPLERPAWIANQAADAGLGLGDAFPPELQEGAEKFGFPRRPKDDIALARTFRTRHAEQRTAAGVCPGEPRSH